MMTVGPLEDDFLSSGFIEYSRRMCGIYMDCASTPIKPLSDIIIHFKILVPGVAAGAIIGKGGETIAQLQKDAGARVKMSKANDFYPGTTERVCLITGTIDSVFFVLRFVQEKIREKPDLHAKPAIDYDSKLIVDRDRQVKILVPNSTAGMVIGKAGNYIKQLKEESGAYVQISQKAKDQTLSERCITVIGDPESCRRACLLILHKVAEDPQSGSCLNVSYADIAGPVANFNPTGSPFAAPCGGSMSSIGLCGGGGGAGAGPSSYDLSPLSMSALSGACSDNESVLCSPPVLPPIGLRLQLNTHCCTSPGSYSPLAAAAASNSAKNSLSPPALDHIHASLRSGGYSEQAANEVTAAISVLSRYGILGVSSGWSHSSSGYGGGSGGGGGCSSSSAGLHLGSSPCLRQSMSRYTGAYDSSAAAAAAVSATPNGQVSNYFAGECVGSTCVSYGAATSSSSPLSAALHASQNCAAGSYGLSPSQPSLTAGGGGERRSSFDLFLPVATAGASATGGGGGLRADLRSCSAATAAAAVQLPINENSYGLGTPQTLASLQRHSCTPSPSPSPSPPSTATPLHHSIHYNNHHHQQQQQQQLGSCCTSPAEAQSPPLHALTPSTAALVSGRVSRLDHSHRHHQQQHHPPHSFHQQQQQQQNGAVDNIDRYHHEIEVSDSTIEAVLAGGDGGAELTEIQRLSGALVQIRLTEGATCRRVLSIAGSAQAVSTAQYLIEQKIGEQHSHHTPNGTTH